MLALDGAVFAGDQSIGVNHFGLNFAVLPGDVNGDGFADLIVGADAGGGPRVTVFSGKDDSLLDNFFAYDPGFRGGVRVAAGDVSGNGFADILTAPGPGGGARFCFTLPAATDGAGGAGGAGGVAEERELAQDSHR